MDTARSYLSREKALFESLRAAVEEQNANRIERAAHAVKGAVNHFHMPLPAQLAAEIERDAAAGETDMTARLADLAAELRNLKYDLLAAIERRERLAS